MKKAFRWIVSSLEDDKGQASYKRIGIAIFLFLVAYMVLTKMIVNQYWLNAFYALLSTASLWVGLITAPQVLMFFGRDKGTKDEPPPVDDTVKNIEGQVTITPATKP